MQNSRSCPALFHNAIAQLIRNVTKDILNWFLILRFSTTFLLITDFLETSSLAINDLNLGSYLIRRTVFPKFPFWFMFPTLQLISSLYTNSVFPAGLITDPKSLVRVRSIWNFNVFRQQCIIKFSWHIISWNNNWAIALNATVVITVHVIVTINGAENDILSFCSYCKGVPTFLEFGGNFETKYRLLKQTIAIHIR